MCPMRSVASVASGSAWRFLVAARRRAKFAEGALGFAFVMTYRLGAAVVGELVALGGEVDLDPVVAVAGLFVGDDEAGGECRFDRVVPGGGPRSGQ